VWSFRDITERRRAETQRAELENQLRQAQKMEAIGSLAGGIAHDFNNILAAVIGNVELARLHEGAECVADELNESIRAAIRAKDLVKQILAFSRQAAAETMPVRASVVAREALKFMRATIPSSIEIQSRIDEASGVVLSNSVELHQIIMNLCTNAVHAIGSQAGLLEVDVRNVRVDPAMRKADLVDLEPGPHVRISVRDSGHGMSPEVMGRIFDPYFTTKDKEIGTGLGLAVVHGIVKKNGGAITVESGVGKGTAFDVYLPAVTVPAPAQVGHDPGIVPGDSERILLVDDEKMLVDIGQQILRRLGYAVVGRTSPIEALKLFKAKPGYFDLVVTDQTMPGMTGDALARELIRIRPGLPVIICTGYSQTIDEKRATGMGVSGFVMKPMLITEISAAVRKALDRARAGEGTASGLRAAAA
jgi:nitrogen-specific signal transduction histidine kinase/CheY-like chemotaxis protein